MSLKQEQLINWVLLFSLVALWGTSFLAIKVSLRTFTPDQVVVLRLSVGAIGLSQKFMSPQGWLDY